MALGLFFPGQLRADAQDNGFRIALLDVTECHGSVFLQLAGSVVAVPDKGVNAGLLHHGLDRPRSGNLLGSDRSCVDVGRFRCDDRSAECALEISVFHLGDVFAQRGCDSDLAVDGRGARERYLVVVILSARKHQTHDIAVHLIIAGGLPFRRQRQHNGFSRESEDAVLQFAVQRSGCDRGVIFFTERNDYESSSVVVCRDSKTGRLNGEPYFVLIPCIDDGIRGYGEYVGVIDAGDLFHVGGVVNILDTVVTGHVGAFLDYNVLLGVGNTVLLDIGCAQYGRK